MFLKKLFHLFFPQQCICCERHLSHLPDAICTICKSELPTTCFSKTSKNELEKTFIGRIPIQAATALLYFSKGGKVQQLIHHLKYKNRQEIGIFTGEWLSKKMIESKRFSTIDMVIPVPLHAKKLKKRGYNQVTTFGKAIASRLHCDYNDTILIRVLEGNSQTKKNRIKRWEGVKNAFAVTIPEKIKGKHILLVDDVITTGATLESCYIALQKAEIATISVATIAFAERL